MKILFVCSETNGRIAPFIEEQANDLIKIGLFINIYRIKGKGLMGYLSAFGLLLKVIKSYEPDIVHAHYGLSGLLANLQRIVPVVTTFHGSDINNNSVLLLSNISHWLSAASIFVSQGLSQKVKAKKRQYIIPCGVNFEIFYPSQYPQTINGLIMRDSINVLFSSSFNNIVKNAELAKQSCKLAEKITHRSINLIELKDFTRLEVSALLNSVDCLLLTSHTEGSPQVIKEAMACNCPIVATDVGDIGEVIGETKGCYITGFNSWEIAERINQVFTDNKRTNGRDKIARFDNKLIASHIREVYESVKEKNENDHWYC